MFDHYPIHDLIENQAKRLGLRRNELARRCGFKNLDKGLRRIDGVCLGDLDSPGAKAVIDATDRCTREPSRRSRLPTRAATAPFTKKARAAMIVSNGGGPALSRRPRPRISPVSLRLDASRARAQDRRRDDDNGPLCRLVQAFVAATIAGDRQIANSDASRPGIPI
jgi:hypothetical protein